MRCPHGALTNSALRVKSHLAKLTLSCCIRGGCPAHSVEAGCFWKQRNKSRTPALLSWFGFQHKNSLEKDLDVSDLWFLPFLLPASPLDKLFKCFPCTRKAWGAEMLLTRQLAEVLKVWGTKFYGPAGQLTMCLRKKRTRRIQLL